MHDVLDSNDNVQAVRVSYQQFFDFDVFLDMIYKRPAAGTVNMTHIFTMYNDKPGILEHKDSSDTPVQKKSMKKGK